MHACHKEGFGLLCGRVVEVSQVIFENTRSRVLSSSSLANTKAFIASESISKRIRSQNLDSLI